MTNNDSAQKEFSIFRSLLIMFQFIVFLIIQLPLLLLFIIGYVFLDFKAVVYSKKHDISVTATNPLYQRWILHKFGLRKDEEGTKMITSLLIISPVGLWLMMGPSIIAN